MDAILVVRLLSEKINKHTIVLSFLSIIVVTLKE
jgi:hypothetical protein